MTNEKRFSLDDDGDWITDRVRAAIEESEAGERHSYDTVDEMIKALRDTGRDRE